MEPAPLKLTLQPLVAEPRRVDIQAVDRELADLWRIAAEASEAERIVLSRARTLTLVVHAADPAAGDRLRDVAAQTCQRHPGRAIVLVSDPAEPDVVAAVNAICVTRRRDQKQVCCEQILINASPAAVERLPSLVRRLVLPDMPVALYWPAPPPDLEFFRDLCDVADRVIVDTATAPDGAGLLATGALAKPAGGTAAPGDLSWARLTAWRGLTAHFFDPPHTEALDRIVRVRVAHAGSSRAQALLYAAWLTARLRWTVVQPFGRGEEPERAALTDLRGRPVTISLHPESRAPHGVGELLSVMITTGEGRNGNGSATFSITRRDDAGALLAVAEGGQGQVIRRALPIDPPDEAALLAGELDLLGHDRVYEGAVRAVAALLGA